MNDLISTYRSLRESLSPGEIAHEATMEAQKASHHAVVMHPTSENHDIAAKLNTIAKKAHADAAAVSHSRPARKYHLDMARSHEILSNSHAIMV